MATGALGGDTTRFPHAAKAANRPDPIQLDPPCSKKAFPGVRSRQRRLKVVEVRSRRPNSPGATLNMAARPVHICSTEGGILGTGGAHWPAASGEHNVDALRRFTGRS
ncbi:Hypothetical predicted protein [Podarcis lilfordi]|uniref:Uncharacterized protein n=1 Tax=Podarcis lilfordi TaxID=74358 RepID=A0AA35KDF1_9SAUR|nr:Hypothetical predicted protein [Podarcis lilfordi]